MLPNLFAALLCRVIYGHLLSYRYPQSYFTFVSRGYFAAIRRAFLFRFCKGTDYSLIGDYCGERVF